jgi:hypothetical protein
MYEVRIRTTNNIYTFTELRGIGGIEGRIELTTLEIRGGGGVTKEWK